MSAASIKRLPNSLRFGGTRLRHGYFTGETAQADGVRRINAQCVELETFVNFNQTGSAFFIGMSMVFAIGFSFFSWSITSDPITTDEWMLIILAPWLLTLFAGAIYFLSGAHRSRGAFIRLHRGTRKLYYIFPGKTHLHVLDWDRLEALAGYIPIITGSVNTTRHPLYLIGVDNSLTPPTEICVACGNLGLFDGDRSAKSLWEYLQQFMAHGPQGLPEPPPLLPRLTRKQATLRRFQQWKNALHTSLTTPRGKCWAPIMVPLRVLWLVWDVFPECLAEFIQYNVPYTPFPKATDELCGFAEKRKPVIRVNGKIVDE